MAIIHELSPHLADLIAAGEVVERPSSVAKELVENAIDAGSARITVEIQNGGITYLRIADNGCGMSPEDAPVAFHRHATSKLRTEDDLSAIGTLGFRGEALAAVSSVTRIDLFTRPPGSVAGLHINLEAGKIIKQEEAGCPEGTSMIVRDLFFNTPARMKFLKKDSTEAGYVLGVVQNAALSHPEIAFTMIRDGKQVFSTDGKGKLLAPVFAVFGKDMTANMLEVPETKRDGISVYGYITKPHAGRANRSMQHFYVNGRYVKSRLMQAAFEEAYRNAIITGKYPSGAVFLKLPLESVDVNVHPAKTEVKFSLEKPVFDAVYIACKNALEKSDNIPELKPEGKPAWTQPTHEDNVTQEQERITMPPPAPVVPKRPEPQVEDEDASDDDFWVAVPPRTQRVEPPPAVYTLHAPAPALKGEETPVAQVTDSGGTNIIPRPEMPESMKQGKQAAGIGPPKKTGIEAPEARVIGECFRTYIVAEDKDGLILIDKHAAHERILFNKLRAETEIPQQELLTPVIVELTGEEAAAIRARMEDIRKAGFDIDSFGDQSFAIRSAPAYLDAGDVPVVISELAEKAMDSRAAVPDRLDALIHTVACKAAIKAGNSTGQMELQSLCDRVLGDENVRSCPHGRPTTVRLTKYELDKLFKRVNQ